MAAKSARQKELEAQQKENDRYLKELRELLPPEQRALIVAAAAKSKNASLVSKAIDMMDRLFEVKEEKQSVPLFALPDGTRVRFEVPGVEGYGEENAGDDAEVGDDSLHQGMLGGEPNQVRDGNRDADPLGLGLGNRKD